MKKMKFLLAAIVVASMSNLSLAQWALTGNPSTNPPTNFVGTTDAKDLVFKTNGTEYMRLIGVATNRGNLGIGTSSPGANLAIAGNKVVIGNNQMSGTYGSADAALEILATTGASFFNLTSGFGTSPTNFLTITCASTFGNEFVGGNYPMAFRLNGAERFRITATGSVGIGTATPVNKLDVAAGSVIGSSYAGTNTAPTNGLLVQGNTGIGTSTVVNPLDVEGGVAIGASYSGTSTAPTNGLIVQGKTGIGTSSIPGGGPGGGYKLAVSGNVNIDSTLIIGTTSSFTASTPFPTPYKLFVAGGILTEKLKVSPKNTSDWSDFVFDKNYKLSSLAEVEKYISVNNHLPGVPSAQEVVANGIDVAKMDAKLLEKIEELTLYMIQQQKQIEIQQKQIEALTTQMSK